MPSLPLDDASCPCAAGFHCCIVENRCLADGTTCPFSKNCPLPPTAATFLEIGTTDINAPYPNFVALGQGGHMTLVHGPQGGYHVNIQVELLGLYPDGLTLTRSLFDPADTERTAATALRTQSAQSGLVCEKDEHWLLLDDQRTFVCPSLVKGQAMSGRDLVLRVEAVERAEHGAHMLRAEALIHPDCPDGDPACVGGSSSSCNAP